MNITLNVTVTPKTNFADLAQALAALSAAADDCGSGAIGSGTSAPAIAAPALTPAEKKAATIEKKKAAAATKKAADAKRKIDEEALLGESEGEEAVTLDEIKLAARSFIDTKGIDPMKKILAGIGVAKLGEVPEEKYSDLMGLLTA